ncbi:MAG: RIP metalloprotease RseP [Clostridia bacterium]
MAVTIFLTIFILGILVLFHELGHFIAAKASDVCVHEFSIGMGPKLISRDRGETTYSLRALPIGGYVRMAGEEPDDEHHPRGFDTKKPFTRIFISIAGVIMNILLAILIFAIVGFMQGVPSEQAIVGEVIENTPAEEAGLMPGDKIIAIDEYEVNSWEDITKHIKPSSNQDRQLTIERDNQVINLSITPQEDEVTGEGVIGITSTLERGSPFKSIVAGIEQAFFMIYMIFAALGSMITGQTAAQGAGPVGIAQMVGEISRTGLINTMSFTAMLSLNVGIFNALPIPPLDGSRILLIIIEAIRGKKIDPKKENLIYIFGFALLITLAVVVTYQDIIRLGQ